MKIYKTFEEFILTLNVLDNEAARYVGEIYNDNKPHEGESFHCNALTSFFIWVDTPQGHKYWSDLDKRML